MRILRGLVTVVLPLVVAGCYMSQKPLISADKAVFPYEKLVYTQGDDAKPVTLTHEGDAYVQVGDNGQKVALLFMPIEGKDNIYVAQFGGNFNGTELYLYGLVKTDFDNKTAESFAVVADKTDVSETLPACPGDDSGSICLTDLKPYIDHAMAQVDSGKPSVSYKFSELTK